ncbi:MAG: hypothetical protein OEW19_19005 [Acidobacteriota bacterium]|nr:hypothetical protein [Acidobacteriota bacterium]
MHTPRFWSNTLILPEADVAIGPLPLSGFGVTVNSGASVDLKGSNFIYRFRALGFANLTHAEQWVNQDLARQGFTDVRWISPDGSRFFVARRAAGLPAAHVGWITHAGRDRTGTITIVDQPDATVRTSTDVKQVAKALIGAADLWLQAFEHPDDAIVHSMLLSSELGLCFRLPAGTVPTGYAYGMAQTNRVGRSGHCRFIADGILARNGEETRTLADALAADPGVRDAHVRMVDSDVAEVQGRVHDDMGQVSELRCRLIPADEGMGLLIATLILDGETDVEAKKLLATATSTVEATGPGPRPVPEDRPASAADALQVIDSFRRRLTADGARVPARR